MSCSVLQCKALCLVVFYSQRVLLIRNSSPKVVCVGGEGGDCVDWSKSLNLCCLVFPHGRPCSVLPAEYFPSRRVHVLSVSYTPRRGVCHLIKRNVSFFEQAAAFALSFACMRRLRSDPKTEMLVHTAYYLYMLRSLKCLPLEHQQPLLLPSTMDDPLRAAFIFALSPLNAAAVVDYE